MFIAIQFVVIIVFLPIKLGVKVHFSLSRENAFVLFAIGKIKIAKLKLCKNDNKLVLFVNGKRKCLCLNKQNSYKAKNAMIYLRAQKMIRLFKFTMLVGAKNACESALIGGVIKSMCSSSRCKSDIYTDFDSKRCDFVIVARANVNLYELLEIYFDAKYAKV